MSFYLRTHLFSSQRVWQPLHYTIRYTITARSVLPPLRSSTHSQYALTCHNLLVLVAMFSDNLSTTIRKWGGSSSQDEDELRFLVEAEKTVIQTSSQKSTVQCVQCEITVYFINVLISGELICTMSGLQKGVGLVVYFVGTAYVCPRTIGTTDKSCKPLRIWFIKVCSRFFLDKKHWMVRK